MSDRRQTASDRTEHVVMRWQASWSSVLRLGGGLAMMWVIRGWLLGQLEGQFSPPVASRGSVALAVLFGLITMWIWFPAGWQRLIRWGMCVRRWIRQFRWVLLAMTVVAFPYVVLYSRYRTKFTLLSVRWLLFLGVAFLAAFFYAPDDARELTFRDVLAGLLLTGSVFAFLSAYVNVSSYPFRLDWSEGNRFWEYSLRFARNRYNYPAGRIEIVMDPGRQFLWGLIFLIPDASIFWARFWNAFLFTVPYLVFAWVAFSQPKEGRRLAFWAGLWGFLFLRQGPIYTPLLLSALLVALADMVALLWVGVSLMAVAGYYAALTRYTWLFAPALWAVILTLGRVREGKEWASAVRRAAWLGAAGLLGALATGQWRVFWETALGLVRRYVFASEPLSVATQPLYATHPLVWSRLWPNPTFGPGILLGIVLAAGPVVLLWWLWRRQGIWKMWSGALGVNLFILAVFLATGVVASLKIGAGDNLHHLDTFLVGVVFFTVVLWRQGGVTWLRQPRWDVGGRVLLALAVLIPMAFALPLPPRSIPVERKWRRTLSAVQEYVQQANQLGEAILFIDHRQLLTFGFVDSVPLVPEYEKQMMMEHAMAGDAVYFASYYRDLAERRFGLIVTEPLYTFLQDENESVFAAENNAWVKWVAAPTLCYYEPIATFRLDDVQLLAPREEPLDCQDIISVP